MLARTLRLAPFLLGSRWDPAQVKHYQDERVRRLVSRCLRENRFYQRHWREAGAVANAVRGVADLPRLPFTTKSHFQSAPLEEWAAPGVNLERLVVTRTSGSTGQPVAIRRTKAEESLLRAFRIKALREYGMGWGDRRAALVAMPEGKPTGPKSAAAPLRMRLGLLQYFTVDMRPGAQSVLADVKRLRPAIIGGHAEAIWRMSLGLPEGELRALGLKFLTGGAETVTPLMRRQIEGAFGCRLYVTYGAAEFNLLASECRETGLLHLNENCCYVEVLVDGRPASDGECGEVFATNLQCETLPFVRYSLGDWATMGPARCPCGAPFRTLREVQGRMTEFFRLPGGRTIHPFQLLNPLLAFTGWLGQVRLIQEREDLVRLPYTVVAGAQEPADAPALLSRTVEQAAGGALRVEAARCERMPASEKGKNPVFESRL